MAARIIDLMVPSNDAALKQALALMEEEEGDGEEGNIVDDGGDAGDDSAESKVRRSRA
jgi:hypothetical protein